MFEHDSPIFDNYCVEKVARRSAEGLVQAHWQDIKQIRFKYKVDAMVRSASCLLKIRASHGSFMQFASSARLPASIKSESDIRVFWEGFAEIRSVLSGLGFPHFSNFISLCHLLMELGFDCAKPDIIVMKAAVDLGIVPEPPKQKNNPDKSRPHPESSLQQAVSTIQRYALSRHTRAPVTDLYFLIHGGQSDAIGLVKAAYYTKLQS